MNFIDLLRFSYVKPKKEIGEKIFSKSVPISFYITWRCPPRLPASLRDSCEPSRVRGTSTLASAAPQPSPCLSLLSCRRHGENQHFGAKSMISLILQIFLLNFNVSPALTSRARGGV